MKAQILYSETDPDIKSVGILSDTQRTLWVERFLLRRPQMSNIREKIREKLLSKLPEILFLNGDLTANGCSEKHWRDWDQWISPIIECGVKLYPVMGNHDYSLWKSRGIRNFSRRFPSFTIPFWYTVCVKGVAFLVLDSNRGCIGVRAWRHQLQWFSDEIQRLDQDPKVSQIQVLSHHSPLRVQRFKNHQEIFLRARKTQTWISGHEHSYTRQRQGEKEWIVWGGGGGPPHGPGARNFGFLSATFEKNFVWKEEFVHEEK